VCERYIYIYICVCVCVCVVCSVLWVCVCLVMIDLWKDRTLTLWRLLQEQLPLKTSLSSNWFRGWKGKGVKCSHKGVIRQERKVNKKDTSTVITTETLSFWNSEIFTWVFVVTFSSASENRGIWPKIYQICEIWGSQKGVAKYGGSQGF